MHVHCTLAEQCVDGQLQLLPFHRNMTSHDYNTFVESGSHTSVIVPFLKVLVHATQIMLTCTLYILVYEHYLPILV